jgi:proline-rich protein
MAKPNATLTDKPASKEASKHKKPPLAVAIMLGFLALLAAYIFATGGNAKSVTIAPGTNQPTITKTETAHAGAMGIFGGAQSLGYGMNNTAGWEGSFNVIQLPNKEGRIFTLKEAVGSTLEFVNYEGEGDGDDWTVSADPDRMTGAPKTINKDSEKLKGLRSVHTILSGGILNLMADGMNGLTGMFYDFAQNILLIAYSPSTICSDAKDTNCVLNLPKITGGDGEHDKGVIGKLYHNFYIPLVFITTVAALVWAFKQVFVNHAVREGITAVLHVIATLVVGTALMLNAGLMASLPLKAMQTIGGYALSLSSSSGDENTGADKQTGNTSEASAMCKSTANDISASDQLVLSVNSMTCTIWRAVRLDPYARAQFGRPFAKLDVKDPTIAEAIKKAEVDPDTFCVPLKVAGKPEDYRNKTLKLESGSHKVCNLAAYQLYLKTNAQIDDNARTKDHGIDQNWYKLIAVLQADDNLWNTWTYSWGSGFNRFFVTTIAMITFVPIGVILIIFSFMVIAQMFIVSVMMIFLPLIMLAWLIKGWGSRVAKKYFWFLLGCVASYIMYSVTLAVSVIILSAVIDTIDEMLLVSVFNFLLGFALWKNRAAILSMISNANPWDNGGISRRLNNVFSQNNMPAAIRSNVFGALGSANVREAWRNRKTVIDPETEKKAGFVRSIRKNMSDGRKIAVENDILTRKPDSARATMIRTRQNLRAKNAEEIKHLIDVENSELKNLMSDYKVANDSVEYGQEEVGKAAAVASSSIADANAVASDVKRTYENINRVVLEFEGLSIDPEDAKARNTFANLYRAEQALRAASHKKNIGALSGDEKMVTEATKEYESIRTLRRNLTDQLTPEQREAYGAELNEMFQFDPQLSKDKRAIEDELKAARDADLKAIQAETETYNADNISRLNLQGKADKTHELKAAQRADAVYKRTLHESVARGLSPDIARVAAEEAKEKALEKFLAEDKEKFVSPSTMQAPNINRLDFFSPAQRPLESESDDDEQTGGGGDNTPPSGGGNTGGDNTPPAGGGSTGSGNTGDGNTGNGNSGDTDSGNTGNKPPKNPLDDVNPPTKPLNTVDKDNGNTESGNQDSGDKAPTEPIEIVPPRAIPHTPEPNQPELITEPEPKQSPEPKPEQAEATPTPKPTGDPKPVTEASGNTSPQENVEQTNGEVKPEEVPAPKQTTFEAPTPPITPNQAPTRKENNPEPKPEEAPQQKESTPANQAPTPPVEEKKPNPQPKPEKAPEPKPEKLNEPAPKAKPEEPKKEQVEKPKQKVEETPKPKAETPQPKKPEPQPAPKAPKPEPVAPKPEKVESVPAPKPEPKPEPKNNIFPKPKVTNPFKRNAEPEPKKVIIPPSKPVAPKPEATTPAPKPQTEDITPRNPLNKE